MRPIAGGGWCRRSQRGIGSHPNRDQYCERQYFSRTIRASASYGFPDSSLDTVLSFRPRRVFGRGVLHALGASQFADERLPVLAADLAHDAQHRGFCPDFGLVEAHGLALLRP
jgi:hypothetical protein